MKKGLLIALLTLNVQAMFCNNHEDHIKLTHPILRVIDGTSVGISPKVYGLILQVRRSIRQMLYGTADKDGHLHGAYKFMDTTYAIEQLMRLEEEFLATYNPNDESQIHIKTQLDKLLKSIKEEFKEVTKSYLEGARGAKEQMLMLIEESCQLRGNPNCFLLRWGETKEGHESVLLDNEIITFKEFGKFLKDLVNFLEDLANSCTKAREQFIGMVRAHKKH